MFPHTMLVSKMNPSRWLYDYHKRCWYSQNVLYIFAQIVEKNNNYLHINIVLAKGAQQGLKHFNEKNI